jgi:hypothetical protein
MQSKQSELLDELLRSKSFLPWSPAPKPTEPQIITIGRGPTFNYLGKTYTNLVAPTDIGRGPTFNYTGKTCTNLIVDERHYAPADLAKAWGVSTDLIRDVFRDEPGVLRFANPATRTKRGYATIRIPESVAQRVHTKLSAIAAKC